MEDDQIDPSNISGLLKEFLARASAASLPVAMLTSGGTTAPLEQNTVRFLDNFSTGRRGAACTEYLLQRGYAVVLLRRRGSLAPYLRHIRPTALLADLEPRNGGCKLAGDSAVTLAAPARNFRETRDRLLTLPFTTVDEYLDMLEMAANEVGSLGRRAAVILAAAVSDFHVPAAERAEHKMASGGELTLTLKPVRKVVSDLAHLWCPQAFVVTFKLETDEAVLLDRARAALHKYGHQLVVANLLQTRRERVTMVTPDDARVVARAGEAELEQAIVDDLARRHGEFMAGGGSSCEKM